MALDLRPAFVDARSAFGVPATVTRPAPDNTPIATEVVWHPPPPTSLPGSFENRRQEAQLILSIPFADVPTVPLRTLIEAPEVLGGTVRRWRVDAFDLYEFDAVRVVVVEDDEDET